MKRQADTKRGENLPTPANGNGYPVTLPPSISDILKMRTMPTQAQMIAVRDWFATYFTQTFRTFDRKTVGRRISPADELMQTAFAFLHIIAPCLPKAERERVYIPLNVLLKAIAERWEDTAAPALGALQHVYELENIVMIKTDKVYQWAKSGATRDNDELRKRGQGILDEYANERRELKKELGKLSAQLLQANPNELKETLAQMKADICVALFDTADKTQHIITENAEKVRADVRGLKNKSDKKEMKRKQRERAAQWLKDENAAGRKASIVDAARQFGNEIRAEKIKGGYEDVASLCTALNKYAKSLGIEQFKDSKRGRPRKR